MKRALEEYKILGTAEDFAEAKCQISAIPSPDNPKMAEMRAQLDALKKEREADQKAHEEIEAARIADQQRGTLRMLVEKAGVQSEFVGMYVNDLERRGLSTDAGRLYIGPAGNQVTARDVIKSELEGSFRVLIGGTVPTQRGKSTQPVADLDPNAVTLAGDPAARQAALDKMASELYPNVVERTTGQVGS